MKIETVIDKVVLTSQEKVIFDQFLALGWLNIPSRVSVTVEGGGVVSGPVVPPQVVVPMVIPVTPPVVIPVPIIVSDTVRFERAFKFVCGDGINDFGWEGDYTNDPNDPGGPTKYGIDTKDDSADWKSLGISSI